MEDNITKQLDKIIRETPKKASEAVRNVAIKATTIIKQDTPKSGQTFRRRQQINASRRPFYTIPLSKSVDTSSLTGVSNNAPSQKVGYRSSVGWYRKFVDHGTTKQKAQKFSDKSRKKISEIAKDEFTKVAQEVLKP